MYTVYEKLLRNVKKKKKYKTFKNQHKKMCISTQTDIPRSVMSTAIAQCVNSICVKCVYD